MSKTMSKGERRRMRKAGQLVDWKPAPVAMPVTRRARRLTRRADGMERWARAYDALNGAPESPEDV